MPNAKALLREQRGASKKQFPIVNVTADEIVAVGSTIELTLGAQVDPQSAQGAIRVVRGSEEIATGIALANRGRVVTVRLDEAAIGACELVVSELLGTKGETLVDRYRLPFSVVPISGKVPDDLRVEHAVRLFIDDLHVVRLAPGEATRAGHVDVVKAVHRTKGTPVELAFDERGERVEIDKQFAQLAQRRADKYGRIHDTLFQRIEQAKESDRVPIVVWPRVELPPPLSRSPLIAARSNRPKARRR